MRSSWGRQITVTLAVLVIYEILRYFPCFGIGYFDYPARLLKGTTVTKFSVLGLGLKPYIDAYLITILLILATSYRGKTAIGRGIKSATLQRIVLSGTLLLALIKSLLYSLLALKVPDYRELFSITLPQNTFILFTVVTMTAGVFLIIWLGTLITKHGVGHGISLLFVIPIIEDTIRGLGDVRAYLRKYEDPATFLFFILVLAGLTWVTGFFLTRSTRINVKALGDKNTGSLNVPLSLAGILPGYAAVSISYFPAQLSALGMRSEDSWLKRVGDFLLDGSAASWVIFGGFLVFFTFFALLIIGFNPKVWAQKLEKTGLTLIDIKPGATITSYLESVWIRVGLQWAGFLLIMAMLWTLIPYWFNVPDLRGNSRDFVLLVGIVLAVRRALAYAPQQNEVYRHNDVSEVLTVKTILESQSIKVLVNEVESLGVLYPLPIGEIGSRRLMVDAAMFDKARGIVSRVTERDQGR